MSLREGTAPNLRPLWVDLHVHTVLSPCAEIEMIPRLIVRRARELGLGLLAVTDHNAIENAGAVIAAAEGTGLTVLPGMEVQTREEVHILCLFGTMVQAVAWQEEVYRHLPDEPNRPEFFGVQIEVDADGDVVRLNERLLLTSTTFSVDDVVGRVAEHGGLTIAAHFDRPAYSLLSNLGLIPEGLGLAAVEVMRLPPSDAVARAVGGRTVVQGSDAHRLSEMRASTLVTVAEPTLAELALALAGREGRKVRLLP